jgi:hypothetical protein
VRHPVISAPNPAINMTAEKGMKKTPVSTGHALPYGIIASEVGG